METFIAFNAGCNIWEVTVFNSNIEWHNNEFKGNKHECENYARREMCPQDHTHYANAPKGSIWDY